MITLDEITELIENGEWYDAAQLIVHNQEYIIGAGSDGPQVRAFTVLERALAANLISMYDTGESQ